MINYILINYKNKAMGIVLAFKNYIIELIIYYWSLITIRSYIIVLTRIKRH